ncbi:MAG: lipopolysaccharide biosynthesis protein [Candidatus Brocadiia bacterium]
MADNSEMDQEGSGVPLQERVVRATGWVVAANLLGNGLGAVRLLVLARLLSPRDFGLFGIVLLTTVTVRTFSRTGFNTALVQRPEVTADYLDTAWTVQVLRGLLRAALLFAAAPLIGSFFSEPRVVPLLRVASVAPVLEGFTNIGIIYFRRELQFRRQFFFELPGTVVSFVVGIWVACATRSAWALVWARLAQMGVQCIASYVLHPYRPGLHCDFGKLRWLVRYGRWMLGSSIIGLIGMRGPDAVLGRFLGAGALGLFRIGRRVSQDPMVAVVGVAFRVLLPAFAKVQDERERLARAFLSSFQVITCLTVPVSLFVLFAGPELIPGLFGPKWADAVPAARILAVASCLYALTATGRPLLLGTGRPHLQFSISLVNLLGVAVSIYPLAARWGVAGVAASTVVGALISLPVWMVAVAGVPIDRARLVRAAVPAAVLGLCVAAAAHLGRLLPGPGPLVTCLWQAGMAAALCAAGAWLTGRFLRRGLFVEGRRLLRSFKSTPAS